MNDKAPRPVNETDATASAPPAWRFSLKHLFLAVAACCVTLTAMHYLGRLEGLWISQTVFFLLLGAYGVMFAAPNRRVLSWFGAVGFLELVAMILLPAMGKAPEAGYRNGCLNNLRQIATAVNAYHDKNGQYPPAYVTDAQGRPLYSWRVLILPYLGRGDIYDAIHLDEPWDSPHNMEIANKDFRLFRCPSDKLRPPWGLTNYVAVVGPGMAWPGATSGRRGDIKDGTSKTVFLVEVIDANIHWMEPRDLDITQMDPEINIYLDSGKNSGNGISSHHRGDVAAVAYIDGHLQFLRDRISAKTLRALLTIDGGETVDFNDL